MGTDKNEIVAIPDVRFDFERMLHIPVKLMEIDVAKKLARHVAEWQPFAFFFLFDKRAFYAAFGVLIATLPSPTRSTREYSEYLLSKIKASHILVQEVWYFRLS